MSRPFEAMYRGTCAACERAIHPGDDVRFDEDHDIVHDECDPIETGRTREVCATCWLTSCDCEDPS